MIGVSHKAQIHNITLGSVIIMIGVNHKMQNHVTLESVVIMIGMLLGEKFNKKTV